MEPTLKGIVNASLQWVFVGGKGGVGKTTTSCALATAFAETVVTPTNGDGTPRPRRVLLVSTDPAHNLSDAFNQKIGAQPTAVNGVATQNLFAMEINPKEVLDNGLSLSADANGDGAAAAAASSPFAQLADVIRSAASTLPGIDEIAVFAEILSNVQRLDFDVVLFDTAPTGHTLRMLALPQTLHSTMDKLLGLENFAPLLEAAGNMLSTVRGAAPGSGAGAGPGKAASAEAGELTDDALTPAGIRSTVHRWRESLNSIQAQFKDPAKTAFVCVCIPEFLSVYETERLIQELMKYNINCDSIVVNQLVLKPSSEPVCRMCEARKKMQRKYLDQIDDLYEDFHLVKMPMLTNEVRGVPALQQFGHFLMEAYDADVHGYLEPTAC